MLRVTKKEAEFFVCFSNMVGLANTAANELKGLVENFVDVDAKIEKISALEHECDLQVHHIYKKINASFVTPIDREDIVLIAREIDNILDNIEEVAHLLRIYNVEKMHQGAVSFADLIAQSLASLVKLMDEVIKMKPTAKLNAEVIEINRLENEGDTLYRNLLSDLFRSEKDAVEIIRWQGIFDYMEKALDSCEDVAGIVEGVVMKHA